MPRSYAADPHSYAEPNEIVVEHLALDLTVDFDAQRLTGTAMLTLDRRNPDAETLVLDTWRLDIAKVTDADGNELDFQLADHHAILGQRLAITVGDASTVTVHYSTTDDARALQWLEPEQTASGKRFLFTQNQPILARTWIPCQDSPGIRTSYEAVVRVPDDLLAVMSATNPTERNAEGVYRFAMEIPVPAYLVALAVGDLEFRALGDRAGVYAEPSVVDSAAWEFADTEQMMEAAERLYGPYRWGRYDLLVLPPSFPYGGMENPRLTFATPTLLAGDRSLVTVVAHELAHSWSGNLVTNSTWDDIWLNEGFTVYFETRIDEELYGEPYANMLLRLGQQELHHWLTIEKPRDTWLVLDLEDPDEGPSKIPYEKGSLFLRMVEAAVGRDKFDAFLRGYFDRFAFESMDTPTFLDYLRSELLQPAGITDEDLQIDEWVYAPGVPTNEPHFASDAFDRVDEQAAFFIGGRPAAELETDAWVSQQYWHFVRALPDDLPYDRFDDADATFGFSTSGNIEIATAWLEKVIDAGYLFERPDVDQAMADFLTRHGRALYIRKVYMKLAATERGLARAREVYAVARPGYHPVAQLQLDKLLGAA